MPVSSPMLVDSKPVPEGTTSNGHQQGIAMNGNGFSKVEAPDLSDDDDLPLVITIPFIKYLIST